MTAHQETYVIPHGGRPPEPPELPVGADAPPRWPAWFAPAGFLAGFAVTLIACFQAARFLRRGVTNYWPKAARQVGPVATVFSAK